MPTPIGRTAGVTTTPSATPEKPADPRVTDLVNKVDHLITDKFGGNYHKAFAAYSSGSNEVPKDDIKRLLADAGVGNGLTRGAYTSGVMDKFDTDKSNGISWSEFHKGMTDAGVKIDD